MNQIKGKKLKFKGKQGENGASGQQTTRQRWSLQVSQLTGNSDSEEDSGTNNESRDDCNFTDNFDECENEKSSKLHNLDQAVFMINFVPLRLECEETIIWENNTPNSVSFCWSIEFI